MTDCKVEDFQKAIHSANVAQPKFFYGHTATERGALLRKWYDLIMENREDSAFVQYLRYMFE
jgi:succinate-semialdehyde dehydrogenase/glutarate-semialdehyde dehydrogenase